MGYEFLIKVNLTEKEQAELVNMFRQKPNYYSNSITDDKKCFEFKDAGRKSKMPDFTISFADGAMYICQNLSSDVWTNLNDVKDWLFKHHKHFDVEEL